LSNIRKFKKKHNDKTVEIVVDLDICHSCHRCELMCSYHHSGSFSHSASSIKTRINNFTGENSYQILDSCDLCNGEEEYLCAKFCPYGALFAS